MCWESCTKIMRKRWVFVAIHQSLWQSPRPCFNEQSQSLLLYHSQWYPQISSDFWLIAITEWFFFFTTFIRFFLHHAAAGALDSFGGAGWIPSSKSSKSSKSLVSFVEYWTILMAPWQPESDLGCFPMTLWTCPFEKRSREVSEIGFFWCGMMVLSDSDYAGTSGYCIAAELEDPAASCPKIKKPYLLSEVSWNGGTSNGWFIGNIPLKWL